MPIDLVTSDMKRRMATSIRDYTYINDDGCQTLFSAAVITYNGVCSTTARIEFEAVELATGTVRRITTYLPVRFADLPTEDDMRLRD